MEEKKEWWERNADKLEYGAFAVAIVAFIAMIVYFGIFAASGYLFGNYDNLSPDYGANLGDFIGGVIGTLFGGATVVLVYLTYKSQQAELKATVKVAAEQSFDNTFFNHLNLHNSIVNELKSKEGEIKKLNTEFAQFTKKSETPYYKQLSYANDYFEILYRILDLRYKDLNDNPEDFFTDNNWRIGHFLLSFISVVELVAESSLEKSKKDFYCRVIKSRATSDELRVIFYFVTFNKKASERFKLKKLFKELYFFDDLRDRDPLIKEEDWETYSNTP